MLSLRWVILPQIKNKIFMKGIYSTLCFTKRTANKMKLDIEAYFAERLIESKILYGTDERGNNGFYVEYTLSK